MSQASVAWSSPVPAAGGYAPPCWEPRYALDQQGALCYELTAANVAEVRLTEELLETAGLKEDLVRRLFGDLTYRSEALEEILRRPGSLVTERSRQGGKRQQVEIALSSLKRVFGLGETLATTLVGLATRIAAKIAAYTYAFLVNRRLGRPQGGSRTFGLRNFATLI